MVKQLQQHSSRPQTGNRRKGLSSFSPVAFYLLKHSNEFPTPEQGTHPYHEAFSAFAGTRLIRRSSSSSSAAPNSNNIHNPNDDQETLSTYLQERGITRLVVTGLATDYCVFHSAMSALAVPTLREVIVLESAMKGVKEESSQEALKKLREAGAVVLENVQELDKWCAS